MTLFELIAFTILIAAQVGIASLVATFIHPTLYYPTVAALMLGFILLISRNDRDTAKQPRTPIVFIIIALLVIALATAFVVRQSRDHSAPVAMAYIATPMLGLVLTVVIATFLCHVLGIGKSRDS